MTMEETKLEQDMKGYAQSFKVRSLLQNLLTDVFIAKPDDPIPFMVEWLNKQAGIEDAAPAAEPEAAA